MEWDEKVKRLHSYKGDFHSKKALRRNHSSDRGEKTQRRDPGAQGQAWSPEGHGNKKRHPEQEQSIQLQGMQTHLLSYNNVSCDFRA